MQMLKEGKKTCIECHYNLVHDDVDWHESMKANDKKQLFALPVVNSLC